MGAYHQMGHDTQNLVGLEGLENFAGVILSPVNRTQTELKADVAKFRQTGPVDVILDPQLYCPRSDRGELKNHAYFPQDFDTMDPSNSSWWQDIVRRMIDEGVDIEANGICSPAIIPSKWSADYFGQCVETYQKLEQELGGSSSIVKPWLTLCVPMSELAQTSEALRIASIATRGSPPRGVYLVFQSDTEPRREITDTASLAGAMLLVAMLTKAGTKVLVSHCSSDMMLMKAAGAAHCATGKFFNLRRFTKTRFASDDDDSGGRVIPYWFETSLCAYLRQVDIFRLQRDGKSDLLAEHQSNSSWSIEILTQFANDPKKSWLGLSWRQYLAWFVAMEKRLSGIGAPGEVSAILKAAEKNWEALEDDNILMEENRNDGRWIRPWRQTLADLEKFEP